MAQQSDRIEKRIILRASLARLWRAISDSQEFGTWFRVKLDGPFVEGQAVRGQITYPGYEHLKAEWHIERIRPQTYLSFRWHPAAVEPGVDYSQEPTTLVEFALSEVAEGTELTITESGFDALPPDRRSEAFRMNSEGWSTQCENIHRHVSGA
jgi:uncharacterized protein YndB with AHSA1/START domain